MGLLGLKQEVKIDKLVTSLGGGTAVVFGHGVGGLEETSLGGGWGTLK